MRRILADGMLVNHVRGAGIRRSASPSRTSTAALDWLRPFASGTGWDWEAQDCASDSTTTATLAAKPGSDEAKVNRTTSTKVHLLTVTSRQICLLRAGEPIGLRIRRRRRQGYATTDQILGRLTAAARDFLTVGCECAAHDAQDLCPQLPRCCACVRGVGHRRSAVKCGRH
jgi:hypothetical protein